MSRQVTDLMAPETAYEASKFWLDMSGPRELIGDRLLHVAISGGSSSRANW